MSSEVTWPDEVPDVRLPKPGEDEAVLLQSWQVNVRDHFISIAVGTTTDGASIPRFLWRICGHPLEQPRVYAAIVHDCIYRGLACWGITREEADTIYRDMLIDLGVSRFAAAVEYRALRWFGGSSWRGAVYG